MYFPVDSLSSSGSNSELNVFAVTPSVVGLKTDKYFIPTDPLLIFERIV
jgi:hypothetical protein